MLYYHIYLMTYGSTMETRVPTVLCGPPLL